MYLYGCIYTKKSFNAGIECSIGLSPLSLELQLGSIKVGELELPPAGLDGVAQPVLVEAGDFRCSDLPAVKRTLVIKIVAGCVMGEGSLQSFWCCDPGLDDEFAS